MHKFAKKNLKYTLIIACCLFSATIFAACSTPTIKEGVFPNTIAENAKVPEKYQAVANELKDFTIAEFTDNISKIPRKSGSVDQIRDYIYNWGISHNLKTTKDQSGCIYYDVPATHGFEACPEIILQAHMDMVQTTADPSIDMNTTPIDIVMDEETGALHSRDNKTNIGADDAEGLTALMGLAINTKYQHGPLRMLFTYDEETTMQGAIELTPQVLNSNYLLNVDGGPVGSACISSAGVIKTIFTKSYPTMVQKKEKLVTVTLKDLTGGHSGIDINKKRMSANYVTVKILEKLLNENINFKLSSIDGGEAPNVIANRAEFGIVLGKDDIERAKELIAQEFSSQKAQNPDDENAQLGIEDENSTHATCLNIEDTQNLVNFLNELPHGCRELDSQFRDKPAVSSNLGTIKFKDGNLEVLIHSRSNIDGRNEELDAQFQELCNNYNVTYTVASSYLGWEKDEDTSLLDLWNKAYKDTCQIEATEYITHGGLECSRFLEKNSNLKMLSIGMDVADEHMVTEALYTKSIPVFYACLINLLENANTLK